MRRKYVLTTEDTENTEEMRGIVKAVYYDSARLVRFYSMYFLCVLCGLCG